jgi:regulator of RNase E activity RraB
MNKLRQIVKDAFKCDELVYQFEEIDVEDGIIAGVDVMAEVNAKYHDDGIIAQAEWRLDIAYDNIDSLTRFDGSTEFPDDLAIHKKEARQLERFLKKYRVAS